jgi:hypothetical protein
MRMIRLILLLLCATPAQSAPVAELDLNDPAFIEGGAGSAGGGGGGFSPSATDLNGGYMVHGGDLSGVADGKQGSFCFFFKLNDAGQNASLIRFFRIGGNIVQITREADGQLLVSSENPGGSLFVARVRASGPYTADSTWHCLFWSFDVNGADPAKRHLWIDTSNVAGSWNNNDANVDWANGGDVAIGATAAGAEIADVSLCEFWFDTTYIDFSVQANREKFRNSSGAPVDKGATGSIPTGSAPKLYLKNPFGTFNEDESGNNNDFTVTGTFQSATPPP